MTRYLVEACPECDSADASQREGYGVIPAGTWLCHDCGARFDEPVVREPNKDVTHLRLLDADQGSVAPTPLDDVEGGDE